MVPRAGSGGQPGQPVPAGFRPVAVVECVAPGPVGTGYTGTMQRRRAAVTRLSGLIAALRDAEAHPPAPGSLTLCLPRPGTLWFVLVGKDGRLIQPQVPVGYCSPAGQAVLTDLSSLTWITLGVTVVPPVVTQDGALPGGVLAPAPRCLCPMRVLTPQLAAASGAG
jgi:hypothetical protein